MHGASQCFSRRSTTLRLARALLLVLMPGPGMAAVADVLVVVEANEIHDRITAAAATRLAQRASPARLLPIRSGELASTLATTPHPALVVTLGNRTAHALTVTLSAPVLHAAIPAAAYPALQASTEPALHPAGHSALFLDQPAARQVAAIRLALPQLQRLGVLIRHGAEEAHEPLHGAAQAAGIELVELEVPAQELLIPRVEQLLRHADALLVTPDATLYNRYTVQKVLLAAYRQRKPVIGLSAAYVDAGALLAIHADPTAIGHDLGDAIAHFLEHGRLAPPSRARTFAVTVNRHVARSLGLTVPDAQELQQTLESNEAGR